MKILFIGNNFGTTLHRYQALKRLGHDVFLMDPYKYMPTNWLVGKWVHETGAWGLAAWVKRNVLGAIRRMQFNLVLVEGGYVISPELVKEIKKMFGYVVNFNQDDPFSQAEWRKWRLYRESIPEYDLIVVVREQNVDEVKALGAKNILHVFRTADEVAHKPIRLIPDDIKKWSSEVSFTGTWMPERGPFMARLLSRGVPLSIWGDRWHRAKEWGLLKTVWRGAGIYTKDYIKLLLASKICLGLLSKGNRDLHTTRSIEIPAVGALLCAERTKEHLQIYQDGKEAVFWNDADECADICFELLRSPSKRADIARRGHERCLKNNYFNEPLLKQIISSATKEG